MSYFESPFHSHILSLRNLSPHFKTSLQQNQYSAEIDLVPCYFCGDGIEGSTSIYCCEKCGYYFHTLCASATPPPRQIQHPSHEHLLNFRVPDEEYKYFYFRCVKFNPEWGQGPGYKFRQGCDYMLSASFAMRTLWVSKYYSSMLPEAGKGESRLQIAHEHPLTSFPISTRILCGGCNMEIYEEAYGCCKCRFFLHESCAKAPLEIQHHPFHPKHPLYLFCDSTIEGTCHACHSWCDPQWTVGYRCERCELLLDLSCVISTMPCEDDDDEREDIRRRPSAIDHPQHPHQLSSYHSKTHTKIECKICEDKIPSGNFFGCPDCSFFLHGPCAQPPAQPPVDAIQHYLHPEHTLALTQCPHKKRYKCRICESRLRSDSYCYTCQMCDFFIHQFCASTALSDLEKGVATTVQYPFHEHELNLYRNCHDNDYYDFYGDYYIEFDDDDSECCTVCKGTVRREILAYKCFSQGCKFKIHKSCLQLPSELEHPSHSLHPLTFCFKPPNEDIACRGCYEEISGTFAFSCEECNFYLHVVCAQIRTTLKHPFHEHHLFYFKRNIENYEIAEDKKNRKCRACRKSCGIDFFLCRQCDYTLHYECSQSPLTIKSKHHGYCGPLVLRESFIEDKRAEYYCDICERRRDPKKWVYYCETCDYDFVAHVECALSPVTLEVIEEDDFIRQKEDIQRREEEIKLAQEQVDAEKERLRPLLVKLELQRLELNERKAEHAKWINMEANEEDESIRGEGNIDFTNGESKKLRAILEKLETEQASWLIEFLKTKCNLPTALFSC